MKNLTQISVTGEEPGDMGRSWTTQDLMGYNGRPWRGFQVSELIRLALEKILHDDCDYQGLGSSEQEMVVHGSRWREVGRFRSYL